MTGVALLMRLLLAACGLMFLLGGIWFLGDPGTYAALIFAVSSLCWAIYWSRANFTVANVASALIALGTAVWVLVTNFDPVEMEANLIRGIGVGVVLLSAFVWFKQRFL